MSGRRLATLLLAALSASSCGDPEAEPGPGKAGASAGGPGAGGAALHAVSPGAAGIWICPMCPQVARPTAGACPVCAMDLVAVPTARAFSCPLHPAVVAADEAAARRSPCPLCGRALLAVTLKRVFRCPDHAEVSGASGEKCPRCAEPLEERLEPLPHGDHNPRHGGILFMAPDQWHHLEGAWPSPEVFRLYLYDDFTRPLPAAGFRSWIAVGAEEAARRIDLAPTAGGEWLEAGLGEPASPPLSLSAFVRLSGKEERFDFVFEGLSKDGPAHAVGPDPAPPAAIPRAAPLAIPATPEEIAAEVLARDLRIRALIARGAWDRLYAPAMEARELALALDERSDGWDAARRARLARALRALVQGAWLLDQAGDRGDAAKAREAHARFSEGIAALRGLFPALAE